MSTGVQEQKHAAKVQECAVVDMLWRYWILQFNGAVRSRSMTSKQENGVLSLSTPKVEFRNNSEKKTIMI